MAKDATGRELRGTLREGFPHWILKKYAKTTNKDDFTAIEYILERWANTDPEAERYGVSLREFLHETQGAEVVRLADKKRNGNGA